MARIHPLTVMVPALILITGCSGVLSLVSSEPENAEIEATSEAIDYEPYDDVLATYVNDEYLVDYVGLQSDRAQLDQFNQAIAAVSPSTYESWSEDEQIAFLINAYNSFTLASIIDQDPLKASIRDIPGVWRGREFQIAGEAKTLDNIEHQTLRVDFNEPRLHAAIVCAALSCPPLRPEAFRGDRLDAQLDDQVEQWLASPVGLQIDQAENIVYISAIFDWFGEDWIPTYGVEDGFTGNETQRAVLNFISQYVSPEERDYLQAGNYELVYLEYDWSLNQQP